MSYQRQQLGIPVWPEGCDDTQGSNQSCVPTAWPEATPRFMDSVHCSSDKPHGVRTQLPPGGESPEYQRFVDVWLRSHDCDRQISVTGASGRDFCCRVGPDIKVPWAALGLAGGILAAVYVWHLWDKRQAWAALEDDVFVEGEA